MKAYMGKHEGKTTLFLEPELEQRRGSYKMTAVKEDVDVLQEMQHWDKAKIDGTLDQLRVILDVS